MLIHQISWENLYRVKYLNIVLAQGSYTEHIFNATIWAYLMTSQYVSLNTQWKQLATYCVHSLLSLIGYSDCETVLNTTRRRTVPSALWLRSPLYYSQQMGLAKRRTLTIRSLLLLSEMLVVKLMFYNHEGYLKLLTVSISQRPLVSLRVLYIASQTYGTLDAIFQLKVVAQFCGLFKKNFGLPNFFPIIRSPALWKAPKIWGPDFIL